MELISSIGDILGILIVLLIGIVVTLICAKAFLLPRGWALFLFIWHTFLSFVYAWYVSSFGGDAIMYYQEAQVGIAEFSSGVSGVIFIANLIYKFSSLSFLGLGIFFSIFGVIGLLAFSASLRHVTRDTSRNIKFLAVIIPLLPSISFWSAGLGKDAISFMSMGLVLWASLNLIKHKLLMIFAIASMLLVRPHMAVLMLIALTFAVMTGKNVNMLKRIFIGIVVLVAALLMLPYGLDYAGLKDFSVQGLISYIELRQSYNWKGYGGGIDISSMSLPMQMFTYLFRPLPFEANSIFVFMASLDNVFLLYLFVMGLFAKIKGGFAHPNLNFAFIWVYGFSALLILSMTTATNLGIAMRQKWMFLPFFIVLFASYIAQKNRQKALRHYQLQQIHISQNLRH
jgi:hypothetical protein